jgi:hypothetical protein
MPRLLARKRNHPNVPQTKRKQKYFKRNCFPPFIDSSILYRSTAPVFHSSKSCCLLGCKLCAFLAAFLNSRKYDDIGLAAKLYWEILLDGGLVALQTQYLQWPQYWERQKAITWWRDLTVPEELRVAAELGTYPTFSLLRIFATLYISDLCDTERSFSALKYIKNYLRSMMDLLSWNELYDKAIEECGKFNRRLSFCAI